MEPIRAPGLYARTLSDVKPRPGSAPPRVRRVGAVAAGTVADLLDRWWNNYSGHGVGLRGGTWTYTGDRTHEVPAARRAAWSTTWPSAARAVWKRYGEVVNVDLTVSGAATGRLAGSWDTRRVGATAVLTGRLDGNRVRLRLAAP